MRIGSVIRRDGRTFVVEDEDVAVSSITISDTLGWEKLKSRSSLNSKPVRSTNELNFGDIVRNRAVRNHFYVIACITKKVVGVYATTISAYNDWKIIEP